MKKIIHILVVGFCLVNVALANSFPEVSVKKINERVYALLGDIDVPNPHNGGYINNNLVVIGKDGIVLVDAGSHYAVAKHIEKAIRKISDKPVTHILITHHHSDHHLGAAAFAGAQVIASEFCAKQIEDYGPSMVLGMTRMVGSKLDNTKVVIPHVRIPGKTSVDMVLNGVKLKLITTETAHTEGDMLVYLPDDGVLASGDILVHGVNPNFFDGNLKKWIGVIDKLRKLPATTILPGHGALMTPTDVVEFQGLIADFYKTVEQTYKAGGNEADVRKHLDLPRWQKMSRFTDMMGRNINKVWLDVEAENF